MADKIFNRASDNYVFTGSRLRAGTSNTSLRLSTASNQAIIDLCNNGNVDISASTVFINGLKVVTNSSGDTTALTALQLSQNLDVSGLITSDGGIQIGSGIFGGTITKSSNPYEIVIDPFAIVGSNSTNVSIGTTQDASWTRLGLDIDGEAIDDKSGFVLSLNAAGNIVAIGAFLNDGNGSNSGHVRIYQYNNNSWIQLGQDIDGEASNDESGRSVILNAAGNIVAIGASYNDGNGSNSGHVRIYQYNNNSWIQLGTDIDGEAAGNQSGHSVSLNDAGDIVAIGAIINAGNGSQSGHTRIYQYNNNSWIQIGSDIDGETSTNQSGYSVSLNADGNIVAIGAPYNSQSGRQFSGHARIYQYNNNSWIQLGQDIDGEAAYDNFGTTIDINAAGNIVAIGAIYNSGNGGNSGHVRVYQYNNNNSWIQLGQDIDGEAIDDQSSHSVSLNDAGNILGIGATFNDGNGSNSGHVRIYRYNDPSWIQLGQDINGEAAGDLCKAVSLNAIGNIVAIGAINNDGNGSNSGHVRIYQYPLPVTAVTDASRSVVIMGDLIVRGNTSTFFSTNVDISDVLLTLASGSTNVLKSNNAGIRLGDGYASLLYNSAANLWKTNIGLDISGRLSLNGGINYSGNVLSLNNSSQLPVTWNTYALKTTGLPASIGDVSNTWIDASGYIISKLVLSNNSFIKIEIKVAYISSPKTDQTLSFRVLRSTTGLGGTYDHEVFSDISLGTNMGVTLNNIYFGTYFDPLGGVTLTNSTVYYKLQFMRNCPSNDSISTPFGIVGSPSANYLSMQEFYQIPIT